MLTIMTGSPNFSNCGIKYITIFDTMLRPNYLNGALFFYKKSSFHVVTVEITKDRSLLNEEDVIIYIGEHHNIQDTEKIVRDKTNEIMKLCLENSEAIFVLNLDDLTIVTRDNFTSYKPNSGFNSLFVFENLVGTGLIYCFLNRGTGNITDRDCFVWLLSYIYSGVISFTADVLDIRYGKQFIQAMSQFDFYKGNKNSVYIVQNYPILNIPLPDVTQKSIKLPLKMDRLESLVERAVYQMYPTTKGIKQ